MYHFSGGSEVITNCPQEQAYVPRLFQHMSDEFDCIPEEPTVIEAIMEPMMDILGDIGEFLMENAPAIAASGGAVSTMALASNPSLPMTTSSGTPPGI